MAAPVFSSMNARPDTVTALDSIAIDVATAASINAGCLVSPLLCLARRRQLRRRARWQGQQHPRHRIPRALPDHDPPHAERTLYSASRARPIPGGLSVGDEWCIRSRLLYLSWWCWSGDAPAKRRRCRALDRWGFLPGHSRWL